MIKIARSLLIIVALVAITAGATHSYFSTTKRVLGADTNNPNVMSYKMATVKADQFWGFPMNFNNMVPGNEYTSIIAIQYTGTIAGDLYFGATHGNADGRIVEILDVAIEKVDGNGNSLGWVTGWIPAENLFTGWTKLVSSVNENEIVRYKVHIKVDADAGNKYQGDVANNGVLIHAVQAGFAAPTTAPISTPIE